MDSPTKFESLAVRFAPYVGDLHEFFVTSGMPYGSPEDLGPFAAAVAVPGNFRDDMCALVRSIIYRENKAIPMVDLLQLLLVAAGGPRVDDTAADLHEPTRQLLSFVREMYRSLQQRSVQPMGDVQRVALPEAPPPSLPAVEHELRRTEVIQTKPESLAIQPADNDASLGVIDESLYAEPVAEPERLTQCEGEPFLESVPASSFQASALALDFDEPASPGESPDLSTQVGEQAEKAVVRPALDPPIPSRKVQGNSRTAQQRGSRVAVVAAMAAVAMLALGGWLAMHHTASSASPVPQPVPRQSSVPHPAFPTQSIAATPPPPAGSSAHDEILPLGEPEPAAQDRAEVHSEPTRSTRHLSEPQDPAPVPNPRPENIHAPARPAAQDSFAAPEPLPKAIYRETPEAASPDPGRTTRPERHVGAVSVSSGIMANHLLAAPPPEYPVLAKMTHVEGQVVLQAFVARDGSVMATHILRGHHMLRGAAEHAVRHWRYRPYLVEGRPTDVATIVTVDFRLHR